MNKVIEMKINRLQRGETIETCERGHSMEPLIASGQKHIVSPIQLSEVKVNDIVFCKVRGIYYTHLVTAIDPHRGLQISNNRGRVNGWTKIVFGKVTKVLN